MKLVLNLSFFLFVFFISSHKSLSITDYEIKKICKKEKIQSNCVKDLLKKRSNLQKGNLIEIPVIPFKR